MTVGDRWMKFAALLNGLLIVIAGTWFAAKNLGNRYFWTDESSTFLSALGAPGVGQAPRGLGAIKEQLAYYFDPGTFHFLVRLWTELFGSSIQALRALPFFFFLLYLFGLAVWYWRLKIPMAVGFAGISVMLLDELTLRYAVELRPYSASLAAAVLLPLLVLYLIRQPTLLRMIVVLIAGGLLGSMQYTEVGIIVGSAVLLGVGILRCETTKGKVHLGVATLFLTFLLPAIFLVTRGLPTAGLERDLTYVEAIVLRQMNAAQIVQTLQTNLFSLTALPRTMFLVAVPMAVIVSHLRSGPNQMGDKLTRAVGSDLHALWLYVLVATVVAAALSALGLLPWIVGTRWSITEIALIGLSIAGSITLAYRLVDPKSTVLLVGVAGLSVAITLCGAVRFASFERGGSHEGLAHLGPQLLETPPGTSLVDYWIYADVRYWMEYSGEYPDLKQTWIDHGVQSTFDYQAADKEDIEQFLDSDYQRLLLRSASVLEDSGVRLPSTVRLVKVPENLQGNAIERELPVLIIKGA